MDVPGDDVREDGARIRHRSCQKHRFEALLFILLPEHTPRQHDARIGIRRRKIHPDRGQHRDQHQRRRPLCPADHRRDDALQHPGVASHGAKARCHQDQPDCRQHADHTAPGKQRVQLLNTTVEMKAIGEEIVDHMDHDDFVDEFMNMTEDQLLDLGFSYLNEDGFMMLIPAWIFPLIPEGVELETVDGDVFILEENSTIELYGDSWVNAGFHIEEIEE